MFDKTKFLWTRIRAEYINPAHVAYSTPKLDPSWMAAIDAVDKADQAMDAATEAGKKADQAVNDAKKIVDEELGPIRDGIQDALDAAQDAKMQEKGDGAGTAPDAMMRAEICEADAEKKNRTGGGMRGKAGNI